MAELANQRAGDIRSDVWDSLVADVRVDESGINVDAVDGTVYLTGVVPSLVQKLVARDIAGRIKGVLEVEDDLLISPLSARSDVDIESDVRAALRRDVLVDEKRIEVWVDQGVVYLSGTAEDLSARVAADDDVLTVKGVVNVVDDIAIVPAPVRLDAEIAEDVRREIERNVRVRANQIRVEVVDGVVYLRGTVDTVSQRWVAEDLARWMPGVVDVINYLKISES